MVGVSNPTELHNVDPPPGVPEGWEFAEWSDGNQQVWNDDIKEGLYIERIVGEKSRRKRWCIVDRRAAKSYALYPPKVAGPFPTLEGAIVAYKILNA